MSDNGDHCRSLACVGGTPGKCNGGTGPWSGNKVECNKRATVQRTYSGSHPAGCYLKNGIKYWNTATGSTNSQARRVCIQPAASVPAEKVLVDSASFGLQKGCYYQQEHGNGKCGGTTSSWTRDTWGEENAQSGPIMPDVWLESLSMMYNVIPTLDGRLSAMVQKLTSTAVLELKSVCAMMGTRRHGKKVQHKGVV